MKKQLPHIFLTLLFCFAFLPAARAVDSAGYLFRMNETASLLSAEDEQALPEGVDAVYAPEELYRTDDPEVIRALDEAGLLDYAEPDWLVTLFDAPDDPAYTGGQQWSLPLLHMDYAWAQGIDGQAADGTRVRIGVVDSGLYAEHADLDGAHLLAGTNYTVSEIDSDRFDTSDTVGHGTFIAGLLSAVTGNGAGMAGLAPEAELVPLKCFTATKGRISDIVAAIYGGVDTYHCQILNMSFGMEQDVQALADAIDHAREQGVLLIAAVGNTTGGAASTGNDPLQYPAAYDGVIGVGSVTRDKAVSRFSYQNDSVFLTAPGSEMYSLGYTDPTAYRTGNSTSYAAPMVTGAAVLALSVKPDMTQDEFSSLLQAAAEDLGDPGWDRVFGYGLLNIGGLLETLQTGTYLYREQGGFTLAVCMDGLTPDSTVYLAQTVTNDAGRQRRAYLTAQTADADGSLCCALPLRGTELGRVTVLALDEAFRPLREPWQPPENSVESIHST